VLGTLQESLSHSSSGRSNNKDVATLYWEEMRSDHNLGYPGHWDKHRIPTDSSAG